MRIGIGLLCAASALLIAAGAYANYAVSNPEGITYYPNIMFVVRPRISATEIVTFIALEHLLVFSGVWYIVRETRRRSARGADTEA